jgi:8-oxo-dGTP pyrophosphatase MutT (NUDIX family)
MSEFDSLCQRLRQRLRAAICSPPVEEERRQAAVALVLRRHLDAAELLIIKRAVSQRDHWSGHLALPGGRQQPEDPDLCSTARRETLEEVGIDLLASGGEVLGALETVSPQSPLAPRVIVTPFVAVAPLEYHIAAPGAKSPALSLNHEVAVAFWVPVSGLKERGRSAIFRLVVAGREREWPAYPTEQGLVWGLTERILTSFLAVID